MNKKDKQEEPDYNITLQFRPGELLGRRVAGLAEKWGVTWNEAARRLVGLAVCDLTRADYPFVERLAEVMGGMNEFFQAADRARLALETAAMVRRSFDEEPMNAAARAGQLEWLIGEYQWGEDHEPPEDDQVTAEGEGTQERVNDKEAPTRRTRTRKQATGGEAAEQEGQK